jgi:uncharacterized protein with HEPN domain
MKDESVYINHILECLEWIADYTSKGRESFLVDRKTQSAVFRELQTMAESVKRLSSTHKDAHPEVFWQGIIGFRNVLVHDYLGIKLGRIWNIIENDLPVLLKAINTIKKEIEK